MALALTFSLSAQPQRGEGRNTTPPTAQEMATRQTERMKQNLSLTDKQYEQIYKLNLEQAKAREAQRKEAVKDQTGRQAAAKESREAYDASLKKILSDEQYQKLQAGRAQMQQHKGKGQKAAAASCCKDDQSATKCDNSKDDKSATKCDSSKCANCKHKCAKSKN